MSLTMSGLDCHRAPLSLREKLAFSRDGVHTMLEWLKKQPGVDGAVLLSTCNRTELYLTGEAETPWRLLCRGAQAGEGALQPYFETRTGLDAALTGCAGKMVSGFSWRYCGVCTAEEGRKLLRADGTPLTSTVHIRFPGQTDEALPAKLDEVTIDEAAGLARFVLTCDSVTGDVLRLGQAEAEVIVSETTGLRVPAAAVHYVLESEAASSEAGEADSAVPAGENYIPGVYVKFGNLARFCRIDPVDDAHPLVTDGAYIIVPPKGTAGSVSEVRLYDQVIVEGQNLYDGKLLS